MSEDTARALGAGSPTTVVIAGRECRPRPLGIRELAELERDCLERYRRSYVEGYSRNLDLLPKDQRQSAVRDAMAEAARWDVDSLPRKRAHDPRRVRLTDALRDRLAELFGEDAADDARLRTMAAGALDQGMIDEAEYRALAGCAPPAVPVPYVTWWITGCFEGMISTCWTCFRRDGVTRDQVADALSDRPGLLNELAREIESLSSPRAGNG